MRIPGVIENEKQPIADVLKQVLVEHADCFIDVASCACEDFPPNAGWLRRGRLAVFPRASVSRQPHGHVFE